MSKIAISEQLFNKILSVLGQLPFVQIAGLMAEIEQDLKTPSEPKPKVDNLRKL